MFTLCTGHDMVSQLETQIWEEQREEKETNNWIEDTSTPEI